MSELPELTEIECLREVVNGDPFGIFHEAPPEVPFEHLREVINDDLPEWYSILVEIRASMARGDWMGRKKFLEEVLDKIKPRMQQKLQAGEIITTKGTKGSRVLQIHEEYLFKVAPGLSPIQKDTCDALRNILGRSTQRKHIAKQEYVNEYYFLCIRLAGQLEEIMWKEHIKSYLGELAEKWI